jgi:hypothetical protein
MRGDQYPDSFADANERASPASTSPCRHICEAVKVLREQDEEEYDFTKAYLQGKPLDKYVVARAPVGHREVDENGYEYYWIVVKALYGQPDAGAIWFRTLRNEVVSQEKEAYQFKSCHCEPALFSKMVGDNLDELVDWPNYVDDGKVYNDPTKAARKAAADLKEQLGKDFKLTFGGLNKESTYVLNANVKRHSSVHTSISKASYIRNKLVKYLPKPVESYPLKWRETPNDKRLLEDFERAFIAREQDKKLIETYGSVVGALAYAVDDRPDIACSVGIKQQALTYPSEALLEWAYRDVVYLYYTADLAIHHHKYSDGDGHKLTVRIDSDWAVKRSRYGYVQKLAGGVVRSKSRKEPSIATSSTEAELFGTGLSAPDVLHSMGIMEALGFEFTYNTPAEIAISNREAHKIFHAKLEQFRHGPVEVETDSKGAYDLIHRDGPGKNSRHIERRAFKMRELRGLNKVIVKLIPTAENEADLMTKPLDEATFKRHRDSLMNVKCAEILDESTLKKHPLHEKYSGMSLSGLKDELRRLVNGTDDVSRSHLASRGPLLRRFIKGFVGESE